MKCPKCSLVTFDHLPKCPKCGQTFRLQRHLTRARTDPARKIVLPGNDGPLPGSPRSKRPADEVAPAPRTRPASPPPRATEPLETTAPAEATAPPVEAPAPLAAAAPVPSIHATDPDRLEPAPPDADPPRRSIFAGELAPDDRQEEAQATPPPPEPEPEPAPVDPHAADAARLRTRMIAASQQRRKKGPDLINEAVDPVLPDWYDPSSLEDEEEAAVTARPAKR